MEETIEQQFIVQKRMLERRSLHTAKTSSESQVLKDTSHYLSPVFQHTCEEPHQKIRADFNNYSPQLTKMLMDRTRF